jgi:hypothetical protein
MWPNARALAHAHCMRRAAHDGRRQIHDNETTRWNSIDHDPPISIYKDSFILIEKSFEALFFKFFMSLEHTRSKSKNKIQTHQ